MHEEAHNRPSPESAQPLDCSNQNAQPSAANAAGQGRGRGRRGSPHANSRRAAHDLTRMPQQDICNGVAALCDCIGHLRRVTNAAAGSSMHAGMERVMAHLTHAAACLPDEMFAVMLISHSVGLDEVRRRLSATVRGEF